MAGSAERARHWRYAELPGVDLPRGRYVEKKFVRHTHENFMIAAIADGVEVFHHGGADGRLLVLDARAAGLAAAAVALLLRVPFLLVVAAVVVVTAGVRAMTG
jgi:hypothetical protein